MMAYVMYVSFAVLVNGDVSPFFTLRRGIRQGYSLSPCVFLFVEESLSHAITEAKKTRRLRRIKVGAEFMLTHFLFVEDVFFIMNGTLFEGRSIQEIMFLYNKKTLQGQWLSWAWCYVLMVWTT
jgi:hypothetical protein